VDYEHRQTEHIILKPSKEANNNDTNIVFIILLVRMRIQLFFGLQNKASKSNEIYVL
jgi:hypothetical protein